ncbi:MAG: 3-hydroxyisobutyrate dehydrogenase [Pseudomonadales bacterium]
MSRVGFVGVGNMGGHMARNLVAAGHELAVFDLVPELMAAVSGAKACASAAEAAQDADVFISMLPAGKHVRSLYLGDGQQDGLLAAMSTDTLIIDCSTIDAASAIAVAEGAKARGIGMLDAPVSGGTGGAEAGTLTFIVGGAADDLVRGQPLFEVMGANIFHAGEAGAGQIAKICNNMLLAVLMAGTAEALALGVTHGLDPKVLSDIMKVSSGGNWALNVYNPYPGVMDGVPAANGYAGGFLVDLMRKDLGLAMQTAEASASPVPLGALANNLYQLHKSTNDAGQLDFSSIQKLFKPDL